MTAQRAVEVRTAEEAAIWEKADQLRREIRALCGSINDSFLQLGARLRIVAEHHLWRDLSYESFEAFIEDPEVTGGLGRTQVYQALKVARAYIPAAPARPDSAHDMPTPLVPLRDVADMGITRAAMIAPIVTSPHTLPEDRAALVAVALTAASIEDLGRHLAGQPQPDLTQEEAERRKREAFGRRLHALADRYPDDMDPVALLASVIEAAAWERERVQERERQEHRG